MKGTKTLFRNPYLYYYDRYKGIPTYANPEGIKYKDKVFLDWGKAQGHKRPKANYYKEDSHKFNEWFGERIDYTLEGEKVKERIRYLQNKAYCGSVGADRRIPISGREDHYLEEFKLIKENLEKVEELLGPSK